MRQRALLAFRLGAAAFAVASLPFPAGSEAATPPSGGGAALKPARPAPPPHLRMRGVQPRLAKYVIDDLGTFSPVNQNHPQAFNNNGDILGDVLDAKFSCVIWNGAHLVDVTATTTINNCSGVQITDVNTATGAFTFTGSLGFALQDSGVGFVATMKPNGTAATFTSFENTSASTIVGIDAAGTALMTGYYSGVFDSSVPFALTGSTPSLLQPKCIGQDLRYCMTLDYFYESSCPFGKCYLSSAGLILAYDGFNLNLMTYRIGSPASAKDLPIHLPRYAVMNDQEQVAYDQTDTAEVRHVYVYDTKTGKQRVLPELAGTSSCDYQLVSQNNVGDVLGLVTDCTAGQFYVLWDATGVHNLAQEIPANTYFSISLLGVNDHGQILAELLKVNAQGVLEYHWGLLK